LDEWQHDSVRADFQALEDQLLRILADAYQRRQAVNVGGPDHVLQRVPVFRRVLHVDDDEIKSGHCQNFDQGRARKEDESADKALASRYPGFEHGDSGS
jgi:hypothetical protein